MVVLAGGVVEPVSVAAGAVVAGALGVAAASVVVGGWAGAGGRLGFQLVIAIGGVLLVRHQALGDLGAVSAAGRGRRLGRHRSQIRIGLAGRRRLAGRGFRVEHAAAAQQGCHGNNLNAAPRPGSKALRAPGSVHSMANPGSGCLARGASLCCGNQKNFRSKGS